MGAIHSLIYALRTAFLCAKEKNHTNLFNGVPHMEIFIPACAVNYAAEWRLLCLKINLSE